MQQIAPLAYNAFKVFAPQSKPFLDEFEENYSGIHKNKRDRQSQIFIESLKKK